MNETHYTPGPWRVGGKSAGCQYDIQSNAEFIAKVAHHLGGDSEAAANACLIAAAPELLQALKMLHDETADYVRINHLGDPYHNRSMQMAKAAIAKAEGIPLI